MDWQLLDRWTRVGVIATVIAVVLIVIPPLSVLSAVASLTASGVGWQRADVDTHQRRIARTCLIVSGALLVFLVVGNVIYAAAS